MGQTAQTILYVYTTQTTTYNLQPQTTQSQTQILSALTSANSMFKTQHRPYGYNTLRLQPTDKTKQNTDINAQVGRQHVKDIYTHPPTWKNIYPGVSNLALPHPNSFLFPFSFLSLSFFPLFFYLSFFLFFTPPHFSFFLSFFLPSQGVGVVLSSPISSIFPYPSERRTVNMRPVTSVPGLAHPFLPRGHRGPSSPGSHSGRGRHRTSCVASCLGTPRSAWPHRPPDTPTSWWES